MTASLARVQRSLGDPDLTYPLWPPLTAGCPGTSTDELAYPLEVDYAYDELPAGLFANPAGDLGSTGGRRCCRRSPRPAWGRAARRSSRWATACT